MTDSGPMSNGVSADSANHRSRTYERPDFPYRCGRERLWSSPCGRGPNADGSCGGVSECLPTRKSDRWRCSRPLWAGGPCTQGPKPDGSCHTQRPPCQPQASPRSKRRRASLLAAFGSIAIIAAFFVTSPGLFGFDRNLSIPGPLTAVHANLIDGKRCGLCHEGHERQGLVRVKALIEYQDMAENCTQCHGFDGQSRQPHNMPIMAKDAPSDIGCIGCHTEHKGVDADISALPDDDCHGCHEKAARFEQFAEDHPPFPDGFGSLARSSIRFDHTKHFETHFEKPEVRDRRPSTCSSCHRPTRERGGLSLPSFDDGCAGCHEGAIRDQPLLLLTWPEMETVQPPDARAADHCRLDEPVDPDNFESASFELPTLLEAFLLNVDPDDIEAYQGVYRNLGSHLASKGAAPLAELIRAKGGDPALLLSGLSPEIVSNSACSWIANQEYEGLAPLEAGGWIAEPFGLSYRPAGHADPILTSWLEFAGNIDRKVTEQPWAAEFNASLFDHESGPGLCASCHTAPVNPGMIWASARQSRNHTVFMHEPHLAIESASGTKSCTTCHETATKPSEGRDFRKVGLTTCRQCHDRKQAGEACGLCHRYHPVK